MNEYVTQYYRCPERYINVNLVGSLSNEAGYFKFGDQGLYYGRLYGETPSSTPNGDLWDMTRHVVTEHGVTYLPFDFTQIIDNLRFELYSNDSCYGASTFSSVLMESYYLLRPFLPVAVRKHLQKARLSDWKTLKFPRWPVDRSIDHLFEQVMLASLRGQRLERIPFIWFWPDGAPSCAIVTHDVETKVGRNHCSKVIDLEDAYGIQSCFAVVPESRYEVTKEFRDSITQRGFEIAIHDLNHDGYLFRDRKEFLARAEKINAYGEQFGANGFRSAALYRNQRWFDALKFSYDMSVPNVGHLEAQRGGCCTVMPYFVGDILELPVTMVQDYALFNYLNVYSIDVWKQQIELITAQHGLMNFIIHPDYITKPREWEACHSLLTHLDALRQDTGLWITTPGKVDRWWRQRAKLKLVEAEAGVRIEGEGSERARVAFASERNGKLALTIEQVSEEPARHAKLRKARALSSHAGERILAADFYRSSKSVLQWSDHK